MLGRAAGSSIRRRWSTHGPAALTTTAASIPNSVPSVPSRTSTPDTAPSTVRRPSTSAWLSSTAPDPVAARAVVTASLASFIWWS